MQKNLLPFLFSLCFAFSAQAQDTINWDIHPNPFRDTTGFYLSLPEQDTVSLTIYDRRGRLIKLIISQTLLMPGSYHFTFDSDTLADDVYFAALTIGSKTVGKKFQKSILASVSKQHDKKPETLVYPNPAQDYIRLKTIFEAGDRIELYSLEGKLLFQCETEAGEFAEIDVSAIPRQVMILSVSGKNGNSKAKSLVVKK